METGNRGYGTSMSQAGPMTSAGLNQAQQAKPMSAMDALNAELSSIFGSIGSCAQAIQAIADRHLGSSQNKEGGVAPSPVPNGTFEEAGQKINNINAALMFLREQISRLERI